MSIGHQHVLFGEISIRVLCTFLKLDLCECAALYEFFQILEINLLSDVLVNIFSHCGNNILGYETRLGDG